MVSQFQGWEGIVVRSACVTRRVRPDASLSSLAFTRTRTARYVSPRDAPIHLGPGLPGGLLPLRDPRDVRRYPVPSPRGRPSVPHGPCLPSSQGLWLADHMSSKMAWHATAVGTHAYPLAYMYRRPFPFSFLPSSSPSPLTCARPSATARDACSQNTSLPTSRAGTWCPCASALPRRVCISQGGAAGGRAVRTGYVRRHIEAAVGWLGKRQHVQQPSSMEVRILYEVFIRRTPKDRKADVTRTGVL